MLDGTSNRKLHISSAQLIKDENADRQGCPRRWWLGFSTYIDLVLSNELIKVELPP